MVNKIGTLKDDKDNPFFPIAGGMAEDSITTQMLKDGAVTSEKIDWTTYGEVLYEDDPGSTAGADISISGGLGYSRLKIVFSSNANRFKTAEIISPTDGQYWALNIEVVAGNAMILRTAVYRVYDNSLTFDSFAGRSIANTGAVTAESTNFIRIHKVIGYK